MHVFKSTLWVLLFIEAMSDSVFAQQISGFVRVSGSLEPIIGAVITDTVSQRSAISNTFGYFTLPLKEQDSVCLKVQYLGFNTYFLSNVSSETDLTVLLEPIALKAVEIKAERRNIPALGQIHISQNKVLNTPSIGGIPDLLRSLATQPGVSSGGEIFAGLYVRGGNDDQNLFLLDGAPIYGTTHLFNIISIFNADALKQAQLYKGLFPARFGGRVSSVLDVNFREGTKEKFKASLNLGILNSSFVVESPLGKTKKTSFLLAGRATYLNLFTGRSRKKLLNLSELNGDNSGYNFFDLNARINHEFNSKNKIYFNVYYGFDRQVAISQIGSLDSYKVNYQLSRDQIAQNLINISVCSRYYQLLSDKLSAQYTISFNRYSNIIKGKDQVFASTDSTFSGNILDEKYLQDDLLNQRNFSGANVSGRSEWMFIPNYKHQLRAGVEVTNHWLTPGSFNISLRQRSSENEPLEQFGGRFKNAVTNTFETALYMEDELKLFGDKLLLHPGLRYSWFETQKKPVFEPRFLSRYRINNQVDISAGTGITAQYLHTLNGDGNRFDKSVWVSSDDQFPAQKAWITTVGVDIKQLPLFNQGFSVEGFYRKMNNLTTFQFNPDDIYAYSNWTQKMLKNGNGLAYGLDMLGQLKKGALSASVAYTLSWNERKFSSINAGKYFPAKYDRRHDLKLFVSYSKPKSKWSFSGFWAFNTGARYTLPVGLVSGSPIFGGFPAYNGINNVKLPPYHRLDLMAKWSHAPTKGSIKQYFFAFNLLNAYAQKNPYGLTLDQQPDTNANGQPIIKRKLKGVALFPILPSLNVGITF